MVTASGWFAARPSGTENIYKIYAESFKDQAHLNAIVSEAEEIVNNALSPLIQAVDQRKDDDERQQPAIESSAVSVRTYRASGLLLHVTSLPSPYGIGDVGPAALIVDRPP